MKTSLTITLLLAFCLGSFAQTQIKPSGIPAKIISSSSPTIVVPAFTSSDITTGLIGWWKFDEGSGSTATDSGSGGHNGTINNSAAYVTGMIGAYALSFSQPSSQYVTMGDNEDFPSSSFSFSCWAKYNSQTSANNVPGIITKTSNNSLQGYSFIIDSSTGPTAQHVYFRLSDGTTSVDEISALPMADGNWHQYVGTIDQTAKVAILYVDGAPSATNSIASLGSIGNSAPFLIGSRNDSSGINDFFTGSVDDVRVYNLVLNQAQVTTLYNYR